MKSPSPQTRRVILAVALIATLILVFLPDEPSPESNVAGSVPGTASPGGTPGTGDTLDLNKLRRPSANTNTDNAFASKSWYVPPPAPKIVAPPPPPPPKPVAPPVPFTFVGETRGSDGQLRYFLSRGNNMYAVAPGDTIEGVYRFDGRVGNVLNLTYLPLNIKQTIILTNAS